jgi:hypothetical protein
VIHHGGHGKHGEIRRGKSEERIGRERIGRKAKRENQKRKPEEKIGRENQIGSLKDWSASTREGRRHMRPAIIA